MSESWILRVLTGPLELLFETVFCLGGKIGLNPAGCILLLSLTMNILVLPLYRRADALQEEERKITLAMKDGTEHVRKTFRGTERYMTQRAYERQFGYKPWHALKGSISLLLQIPFFMAAYRFLSGLRLLEGAALGPIADLSRSDALLIAGGMTVNLLPLVMTGINLISGALYLKGMPLKNKLQTYGIAMVFLALLYDSPAGLVLYWTLNNLFSLAKNIIRKTRKPKPSGKEEAHASGAKGLFLWACLFLTILTGALIPSAVVKESPAEFVNMLDPVTPNHYVVIALCTAAGLFLLWFGIFYRLTRRKRKFETAVCVLCGVSVVSYLFFGTGYGMLSDLLVYDSSLIPGIGTVLLNLDACTAVSFGIMWMCRKKPEILRIGLIAAMIAAGGMSVLNAAQTENAFASVRELRTQTEKTPEITLSRTGKNVVIIMLDRAVGPFVPYIMEEKPELREAFDGFTWYSNTLAFGTSTIVAAPALYGGYDYTPETMNARTGETLRDKHNEALKVLPTLFRNAGFATTVCDPPLANYSWVPDLSIYEADPDIRAYNTMYNEEMGYDPAVEAETENIRQRNFFSYALFRAAPSFLHILLYDGGNYLRADSAAENAYAPEPTATYYRVMDRLKDITRYTDREENTFLMLANELTHAPEYLRVPDYVPVPKADDTARGSEPPIRLAEGRQTMDMTDENKATHYHVNMAAFLKLGEWFEEMKRNGVYDNTRIILVSDHGNNAGSDAFGGKETWDTSVMSPTAFLCLMMVKDFDATGFSENRTFMTNADTPALAVDGLTEAVNPFTGNSLIRTEEDGIRWNVMIPDKWMPEEQGIFRFTEGKWYTAGKDVTEPENWEYAGYK